MKNFSRYAALACLLFAFSFPAFAQRSGRPMDRVAQITKEEAIERWNEFQNSRMAPFYTFRMELEHRPRRGESVFYDALMLGRTVGDDSAVRVDVSKRGGGEKTSFLILSENGKNSIYKHAGGKTSKLDESEWQAPLMDGLIYTPFDVLMPYKRWKWAYHGSGRVGRALYFFDLAAPADFAAKAPEFARVRMGLDREFNAPFQTEYFDAENRLLRTLSLFSVKKFHENWITKQVEMLESETRDKDRISITHGSFEMLPDSIFDRENLGRPAPAPALEGL